jgi:hypothetical protein
MNKPFTCTASFIGKTVNEGFVDMDRISEHTPYQSKKVEKFLNGFEKRIEVGTVDVFVNLKNKVDINV